MENTTSYTRICPIHSNISKYDRFDLWSWEMLQQCADTSKSNWSSDSIVLFNRSLPKHFPKGVSNGFKKKKRLKYLDHLRSGLSEYDPFNMHSICSSAHPIYRQSSFWLVVLGPLLFYNAQPSMQRLHNAPLTMPCYRVQLRKLGDIPSRGNAQHLAAFYRSISSNPSDSYPLHTRGSR